MKQLLVTESEATKENPPMTPDKVELFKKMESENTKLFQNYRKKLSSLKQVGDECEFHGLTGYQRNFIHKIVQHDYQPNEILIFTRCEQPPSTGRYVVAKKIDPLSDSPSEHFRKEKLSTLNDCFGFSRIIKAVSTSGKLVLGHNMLLDVMYIINQFFTSLPDSFEDFKEVSMSVFPKLCDTKVLASTRPFKEHISRTALEDLFTSVAEKPFKKPSFYFPEGFTQYQTSKKCHEAAYDAYMTGASFAAMKNYLGSLLRPPKHHIPASSELITPFVNKIYLMNIIDMYYLDVANDDALPDRSKVFYMEFPEEWNTENLCKLFSTFSKSVEIHWINSTSAFVELPQATDPAMTILTTVKNKITTEKVVLKSFKEYKKSLSRAAQGSAPKRSSSEDEESKVAAQLEPNPKKVKKLESSDGKSEAKVVSQKINSSYFAVSDDFGE